jgi:sensor histidine kinase YesM
MSRAPPLLLHLKRAWAAGVAVAALAVLTPALSAQGMSWVEAAAIAVFLVASGFLLIWTAWRLILARVIAYAPLRVLGIHAVGALLFALLWALSFAGLVHTFLPRRAAEPAFNQGLAWIVVWGIAIYAALAQFARAQLNLREREAAMKRSELVALRSQLDPHFLFNTLHSLTQLAREDPVATEEALERFGNLMRYVLSAGRDVSSDITLEEEVAFVDDYLALEKLRLGERLRVSRTIDPDALELGVPPLLLQPLVENAVRHGIAPRREGGAIRLSARTRDAQLQLEVSDDGPGVEQDAWRRSSGLGLRAVERQLRARYGDEAMLEVETSPGKGFIARITMPGRTPDRAMQR